MAFLDNSGDIILDAVLTDTGRKRLAKGDGSFRITKFAFGDDEINYTLYDLNHASGSAYFDLNILQSPIFEAFTNNTSVMKSRLLTIARTDLLYLPVVQLNTTSNNTAGSTTDPTAAALADTTNSGSYVITVNAASSALFASGTFHGVIQGDNAGDQGAITFDQGIDNDALGLTPLGTANTLTETAYVVEIDNRLGVILDPSNGNDARVSFVDDDQIASYYISLQGEVNSSAHFETIPQIGTPPTSNALSPIAGRPGLRFKFKVRGTDNLAGSNYLFDTLGASDMVITQGSFRYIDSTIRVTGFTTGFRVDIPVRFVKLI
tara:strand:- start:4381 stop:5340 length:960 start_codon:yes stop_codon:yes gene_type:complete